MRLNRCLTGWLALCLAFAAPLLGAESATEKRAKLDAAVRDAKAPVDKIVALYQRAAANDSKVLGASDDDLQQAARDIDEAIRLLEEEERKGPFAGKSVFYLQRGLIARELDKLDVALRNFDNAEAKGWVKDNEPTPGKGAHLWLNRSQVKLLLGDYSGALKDADIAVGKAKRYSHHQNRARIRFELGDYDGAIADWKTAREINSIVPARAPFDREVLPLNAAVVANPKSVDKLIERAHFRYWRALNEGKKLDTLLVADAWGETPAHDMADESMRDLERAIRLEPKSARTHFERGRLQVAWLQFFNAGSSEISWRNALNDLTRAIALDPKNAAAFEARGDAIRLMPEENKQLEMQATAEMAAGESNGKAAAQMEQRAAQRRRNAIADLSRAIYLAPQSSGQMHFERAQLEKQNRNPDPNTLFVDYDAAIAQNLSSLPKLVESNNKVRTTNLAAAHRGRGIIHISRGQITAAQADFERAIELAPYDALALTERGKVLSMRGQHAEALKDFDSALGFNKNLAETYYFRAIARDATGNIEGARADLQEAFKRDQKMQARVAKTRYDEKNPVADKGLAPPPRPTDFKPSIPGTPLEWKNKGNELSAKNDEAGALHAYNLALMIDPKFTDGLNNRGNTYAGRGQIDLAMSDYNRAIELEPKHRVAYFSRAAAWRMLSEWDKARTDLDRAVEYADTPARRADILASRSMLRAEQLNDRKGALEDARLGTQTDAKSYRAWHQLGLHLLNENNVTESIAALKRSVEIEPEFRDARILLSIALSLNNDADNLGELKRALDGATPDKRAYARRTVQALLNRKPDSAPLQVLRDYIDAK